MKLHLVIPSLIGGLALALTSCAGSNGAGTSEPERDYPQAPMRVSVGEGGVFQLTVCATEAAVEERGPWIASIELQDLQVDPPLTLWEAVLPSEKRSAAWNWNPGTPWRATMGKAPDNFEDRTKLKTELKRDRLYQVSITGWDPGELLFAVAAITGEVTYYDAGGRRIARPRMPCLADDAPELVPVSPGAAAPAPAEQDDAPEANFFK